MTKLLSIISVLIVLGYFIWLVWIEWRWLGALILYTSTAIPFLYGLMIILPTEVRVILIAFFNSLPPYPSNIPNPDPANLMKLPHSTKSQLLGIGLILFTVICWGFFISEGLKFP